MSFNDFVGFRCLKSAPNHAEFSEQTTRASDFHQPDSLQAILDCMRMQNSLLSDMRDTLDSEINLIKGSICAPLSADQSHEILLDHGSFVDDDLAKLMTVCAGLKDLANETFGSESLSPVKSHDELPSLCSDVICEQHEVQTTVPDLVNVSADFSDPNIPVDTPDSIVAQSNSPLLLARQLTRKVLEPSKVSDHSRVESVLSFLCSQYFPVQSALTCSLNVVNGNFCDKSACTFHKWREKCFFCAWNIPDSLLEFPDFLKICPKLTPIYQRSGVEVFGGSSRYPSSSTWTWLSVNQE